MAGERKPLHWAQYVLLRMPQRLQFLIVCLLVGVIAATFSITYVMSNKWQRLTLNVAQRTWIASESDYYLKAGIYANGLGGYSSWRPQIRVAYLISCHDLSTARGAEMLVHELYHPDHLFVIHFDRKLEPSVVDEFRTTFAGRRNLIFVQRYYISWGSYEVLRMMMLLLRTAYEADHPVDAFMNLCGHTVPLKSNVWIDKYLSNIVLQGKSLLFVPEYHSCHKLYEPKHICNRTMAYCADEACSHMVGTPGGKFWYKGSQWWVLNRDFVHYVLHDPSIDEWLEFWRQPGVEIPDEGFFQTVLVHSPFKDKLENGVAIYVDWREKCLSSENQRPQQSPCYLGPCDLVLLSQSDKPFARKVTDTNLIRKIIRKLRLLEDLD